VAEGHLVHGLGTGLAAPAWPPVTPAEAAAVLARVPGAGVLEALEWHSPRPFSAAALARTSQGELFLKRHSPALRSPAGLAEEHAFIAHLRQAGLPVADVLADAAGASAFALGGWSWEVHRKSAGEDLYRERPSWTGFLCPAHAHAAGAMLGRLHRAAAGFAAPARAPAPLVAGNTLFAGGDPQAAAEAFVARWPALGAYFAGTGWRAELAALLAAADAAGLSRALGQRPTLWGHGDWHPSNLLWDGAGGVAGIMDFGLADRTCALFDLAIALERSVVAWLQLGKGEDAALADLPCADALLAGYASAAPLTGEDRALLARLLPLVHVEFALSEMVYFEGILALRADTDLAWHTYLLGHARWFAGAGGQALLAATRGAAT